MAEVNVKKYSNLLASLTGAIKQMTMYPAEHHFSANAVKRPLSFLEEIFQEQDNLTLILLGDKFEANGITLERAFYTSSLALVFHNFHIKSLTFRKPVNADHFRVFLNFLSKKIDNPDEKVPLFLKERGIVCIGVNELKYVLVGKGEEVMVAEQASKVSLKSQLSELIKEHPEILKDLIFDTPYGQKILEETHKISVDSNELKNFVQGETQKLSDDEILDILLTKIKSGLEKAPSAGEENRRQTLTAIRTILEKKERVDYLPQVKKLISELGILDEQTVDLIFEKKFQTSKIATVSFEKKAKALEIEKLGPQELKFLAEKTSSVQDWERLTVLIDTLVTLVDDPAQQKREKAVQVLTDIVIAYINSEKIPEFNLVKDKLLEKIKKLSLSADGLSACGNVFKVILQHLFRTSRHPEAKEILVYYNSRLIEDTLFTDEIRNAAYNFLHQTGSEVNAALLIGQLLEASNRKPVEEILELLATEGVACKLVEIMSIEEREIRLWVVKALSRMPEATFGAIDRLLQDRRSFIRKGSSLTDSCWFKIRNALTVLGNIKSGRSVDLIARLKNDPDPRVRCEIIRALERQDSERVLEISISFLADFDSQVRKNVVEALGNFKDEKVVKSLINDFIQHKEERSLVIASLGKIGGKEVVNFLLALVTEQQPDLVTRAGKIPTEIKLSSLQFLDKWGDRSIAEALEKFLESRKKMHLPLFTKDHLASATYQVIEKLIKKSLLSV